MTYRRIAYEFMECMFILAFLVGIALSYAGVNP